MIRLPKASARNALQTQNRKRLLAEITSEQMWRCSRDYRQHLAVCEKYDTEPTNFAIFAVEWLEVRAKVEETPAGKAANDDCQARNYGAMYYGIKGYE